MEDTMSVSKPIHYHWIFIIIVIKQILDSRASTPLDTIILNAADKDTGQSFSAFQNGISAAVHETLQGQNNLLLMKTATVDTVISTWFWKKLSQFQK